GIPIDKDSPYREKVIEAALKASRDDHRFVRISSLVALRKWGPVDDRFFDRITDFLTDSAEMVRYNTVLSLEDFASGVKNPYPAFQKALNSDDPFVREAAAKILIQHLDEKVVVDESKKMDKDQQGRLRQLSKDLSSENPQTRQETIDFLIKIARPDIANLFVQLHDSNPNKTVWPRMVFKWIGDATAQAIPLIVKDLETGDVMARVSAANNLGEIGFVAQKALPALNESVRNDVSSEVRKAAQNALKQIEIPQSSDVKDNNDNNKTKEK
ncbi:MAG: hypothetical protein WBC05_07025, partial [Sedimentisphaerales bacterium]